mmetsp:Transcript_69208/g.165949  ORF Transcript_69208/g.165949 Transcript_69208/m.165949 type:complete len:390 (-) Transcript_69208:35-1204(-)
MVGPKSWHVVYRNTEVVPVRDGIQSLEELRYEVANCIQIPHSRVHLAPQGVVHNEQGLPMEMVKVSILKLHQVLIGSSNVFTQQGQSKGRLELWDLSEMVCKAKYPEVGEVVTSLSMDMNGTCAAAGLQSGALTLWDLEKAQCLAARKAHEGPVTALHFNYAMSKVVTGGGDVFHDCTVKIWETLWDVAPVSIIPKATLQGHTEAVFAISAQLDVVHIAVSASRDTTLMVWDVVTEQCHGKLLGHQGTVHAVQMDAYRCRAVSASQDGTLRVWDLQRATCLFVLVAPGREESLVIFSCLAASFEHMKLIAGDHRGGLHLWDLGTREHLGVLSAKIPVSGVAADFVAQRAVAIVASDVCSVDLATWTIQGTVNVSNRPGSHVVMDWGNCT